MRLRSFVSAGVLLVVGVACGSGSAPSAPASAPPTPVKVWTVSTAVSQSDLAVTGTVEAAESAVLRPEASGPIASLGFDHGDRVKKGQTLLRLRDAEARAAVAEAEARLALAQSQLDRTAGLVERQNASRADLDRATADRDLARAQLDRAREDLRRTTLAAPFDGVVGLREVAPGEIVDPSRVVTRIEAVDRVVVDLAAPERWLPRLVPDLPAQVAIDALPGEVFEGRVSFVGPRVAATTRTAPVRIEVPNPDGRLRPGMSARVSLVTAELADAILIPTEAVVTGARGASVWVVGEGDVVQPRPIETAERSADRVRVAVGLSPGERVVVEGLIRLRPGATVQVLEEVASAAAEPR